MAIDKSFGGIATGETQLSMNLKKEVHLDLMLARPALLEINNIIQCRDVDQDIKMLLLRIYQSIYIHLM